MRGGGAACAKTRFALEICMCQAGDFSRTAGLFNGSEKCTARMLTADIRKGR